MPGFLPLHTATIHLKTYAKMGGAFGETGIKDGTMNWLVGDQVASSIPYFCGWMASGYFVAGDIRDIGETLYQGDGVGTALNAAAFLPYVGDTEKTGKTLVKLGVKYPNKINKIVTDLIRTLPDSTPDALKSVLLNRFNGREADIVVTLRGAGKSDSEIYTMARAGDGLITENLKNTIIAYNNIPGNLNKFKAIRKKTVLGPYIEGSSESYEKIAKDLGSNCLNINKDVTPYSWETNKMLLDMASDNGDEVILTVKQISSRGDWSKTLRDEVAYLEGKGYTLLPDTSTYQGQTGTYQLFKMVKG